MPTRLDHVTISLEECPFTMTWEARSPLISELRHTDGGGSIIKAFEDVGATSPVELTLKQRIDLFRTIEDWSRRVGFNTLPRDILRLRNALSDDLHDDGQRR